MAKKQPDPAEPLVADAAPPVEATTAEPDPMAKKQPDPAEPLVADAAPPVEATTADFTATFTAPRLYRVDGTPRAASVGELWRVSGGPTGWPGGPYTFDAREGGQLAYQVTLTPTQAADARLAGYIVTPADPAAVAPAVEG